MAENETNQEETPEQAAPDADNPVEEPAEEAVEEEASTDEEAVKASSEEEVTDEPVEGEESVEDTEGEETPEPEVVEEEEDEAPGISAFDKVTAITSNSLKTDIPDFRPGDNVKVHVKIIEGEKERIQVFEGVVIALKHGGMDQTFKVRKTSWGVGVERTFFVHSPKIAKIEVARKGHVRRAKLYYLRERAGKGARIKERRPGKA